MYFSTLSKIPKSAFSSILTMLLTAFFSFTFTVSQAQNCTNPPSVLVNGNFDLPATIGPNNTGINDDLLGWFVSHGHPTTGANSPRSMWMWSYTSTNAQLKGEGVFNCYDFQQGQSYLICFDLQTNSKADGATVDVRASNALSAYYGNSSLYPTMANELIWQDLTVNYDTSWSQISVVYTPTSNYSQIWFHPLWTGVTPGTPAPYGNPGQAEMRIDNVSITPVVDPADPCSCDLTSNYTYSTTDSLCAIQFNEVSSGNCCTDVVGWQWDFGDGTTATGPNPLHTFPASGTYNVCLTTVGLKSNGDCCTDSVCYSVTVNCEPCVCDVNADFQSQISDCQVRFTDISTQSSCTQITGWNWNFGDGNTSNIQNPIHQYTAPGIYSVCLIVSGTDGNQSCEDTICYDVKVDCEPGCRCTIDGDFTYDIEGCSVNFTGFGNSDCEIIGWSWDFGDGNASNQQNPSHNYNSAGVYNVCLTISVKAPDGTICTETFCHKVVVEDCEGCECTIDGDFTFDIDGCNLYFSGFGNSDCEIIGWSWDFGDGNTSNQQNPSHSYSSAGVYNVCLTISAKAPDGTICTETFCQEVAVEDCEGCECTIDGDFAFDIDGCNLYFAGFGNSDCEIVEWNWDFGDGNTSTQQNPVHTYSNGGIYNVCLTIVVMSADGTLCSETFCQEISVEECEPGIEKKSETLDGSTSVLPFEPRLYPNPTAGTLFIEFNTQTAMDVKIDVFNSAMEHVTTLADSHYEAGNHKLEWLTAKNNIASGTYYVLLKSGSKLKFEKVILQK